MNVVGTQTEVCVFPRLPVRARLSRSDCACPRANRDCLPVIDVASTVSPVAEVETRVPGVDRIGSPSCWTDGAPSSRFQLVMRLKSVDGRPVQPGAESFNVPKSESGSGQHSHCSRSPRALDVAIAPRDRQVDVGARAAERSVERFRRLSSPALRASVSWWSVFAPTRECCAGVARWKREQRSIGHQVDVRGRSKALARSRGVSIGAAVAAGVVLSEITVSGGRPMPLVLVAVERETEMPGQAVVVAYERIERDDGKAEQGSALAVLRLRIHRRTDVAQILRLIVSVPRSRAFEPYSVWAERSSG